MGEIVGAFGVPHNPHFPTWVAEGHPLAGEISAMYEPLAAGLKRVRPDTLVYITSDHYNLFWEMLPIFAVGVADSARGASDYPNLPARELRIDASLAREIHGRLVGEGFDAAQLQELEFDHTVIAPMHFLAPDVAPPLVPLYVSVFLRPLPSARRCLALGRALRAAIEASPNAGRVAVVGTGSFSLEIGGPRISEDSHTGVPDPAWLERVLRLLRAGDLETLVHEAGDDQLWAAGNAGGEILNWITTLGTFDPRPPEYLEAQPAFGHAFAFWPLEESAGSGAS